MSTPRLIAALALVAVTGATLVWLSVRRHGAGLSPDSAGYVSAARSLVSQHDLRWFDGSPLVAQPPLYPAALAIAGIVTSRDPLRAAAPLNLSLYVVTIGTLSAFVLRRFRTSPLAGLFCAATAAVSFPLYLVAVMAWSEQLFILLVICAAIAGDAYAAKPSIRRLATVCLLAAVACLTRYAGVTLLLWGTGLVLAYGGGAPRARIARASCFACVSSLPLAVWAVRNWAVSGTLFGPHAASAYTLTQNIRFTAAGILSWYAPVSRVGVWAPLLLALLAAAAGAVALRGRPAAHRGAPVAPGPWLSFVAIYAGFLILASTASAYDQIDDRLLAPIAAHVSLLGACGLDILLGPARSRRHVLLARSVAALVIVAMLVWPAARAGRAALRAGRLGIGLASVEWKVSETVHYLARHGDELRSAAIYSNAPDAVYLLAGLPAKWSPARTEYNSSAPGRDVGSLRGVWPPEDEATLAWFETRKLAGLYTVDELRTIASIEKVASLNDGSIFVVSPTAPAR